MNGEIKRYVKTGPGRYDRQRTPLYEVWRGMKKRCCNSNRKDYAAYGGRGIHVCDRWLVFENFAADMGNPPAGYTLDRIDVNRGYEPDNCRWASRADQARNRRRTKFYDYKGEKLTAKQVAAICGKSVNYVRTLLKTGRLPMEEGCS